MIADGKIRVKNGSQLKGFTQTGLEFADGSTLDADVFLFATGYVQVVTLNEVQLEY